MSAIQAVLAARELLENLTPLKTDCGRLCQAACCQGDENTGMLLFPEEETLYEGCAFADVLPLDYDLGGTPAHLFRPSIEEDRNENRREKSDHNVTHQRLRRGLCMQMR